MAGLRDGLAETKHHHRGRQTDGRFDNNVNLDVLFWGGGVWVVSPEVPPSHLSQIGIESLFIPQWGNYRVKKKPIWVLNDRKYNVFFLKKQYLYL